MWKLQHKLREKEGGEGGSGGGGGDAGTPAITPEVQALIDKAVGEAVTGLKTKNGELIAAQKQLKEQLQKFEGIDPEAVNNIIKRFADDEEAGLIKAGKLDEVLNKRTERMKASFEKETAKEKAAREAAEARVQKYARQVLENHIRAAAAEAGLHKHAIDDALLRAQSVFALDDDANPIAGEDVLGKDGKPLTLKEWFTDMKERAPHWWPATQGGGASGGGGNNNAPAGDWTGSESERLAAIRKKFPDLRK